MTDDSGLEFVVNLKTKSSLTVLDLRNTLISDEIIDTINSCMKRNRGDIEDFETIPLPKSFDSTMTTTTTTTPRISSNSTPSTPRKNTNPSSSEVVSSDRYSTDVDEESDRSENTKSVSSMSQDELLRTVKKMQQKIRGTKKKKKKN